MNKTIAIPVIAALVFGAAGFAGGMYYQKQQLPKMMTFAGPDGRFGGGGDRFMMRAGGNGQRLNGNGANFRPVSGEILSQDDTGVTVKLPDGSSKIVFVSGQTKINKTTDAAKTDLTPGQTVTVFGTTNSDGSVTAQNVMLGNLMVRQFNGQPQPTGQP